MPRTALSLAVLALAAYAPPALADARLEPAFENTIVSTYPDGRKARLWLNPGGTYSAAGRTGRRSSGRWSVKGEQVCLRQRRPIPVPFTYCTRIVEGGVGTKWRGKAVTGEAIAIQLVAGR